MPPSRRVEAWASSVGCLTVLLGLILLGVVSPALADQGRSPDLATIAEVSDPALLVQELARL